MQPKPGCFQADIPDHFHSLLSTSSGFTLACLFPIFAAEMMPV
jgi:hypothetical protein